MGARRRWRRAVGWIARRPWRACVRGLAIALVLPAALAVAQPPRSSGPLEAAQRAFLEGRYGEVPSLVQSLDPQDPGVVAVRARALIARGQFADAEMLLQPAAARAPASEPALELGLLQQRLGRPEAAGTLGRVAARGQTTDNPRELGWAARALRALGRFREANAAYRDALAAAPLDPGLNTAWGELFLETYSKRDALKSFQVALQQDAAYAPALLGQARALAEENPPQAVSLARRALEINPSSVEAQVFLAGRAIDAGRRDEARQALGKALAVNPSSLEAHAWLGALAHVEDRAAEYKAETATVLALSPHYGEVYRVAGELAAANYRFDEAVALARQAQALTPDDPHVLADLGVHLLRTGDEPGARAALQRAFALDPYNVVSYNLLQMMDTLDAFVTVRDGGLVLRMAKDEAPVLQDYALALAHRALDTLSKKYAFTPQGPILIEIFPKHDDFAVRNVGLPGMTGALGACFGRVVTMDSPRARPPGEFQWEATLWHELAHVVTIQMSKQRVPRWLTEGISVYEEKAARSEWSRGMDVTFADLLNRKATLPVKDLNAAFTDPKTISLAYFEASLLVDHIVRAHGEAGLHRLLRAYGDGLETEAALKSALQTDFDRLQGGFDDYLEGQFGALRQALAGPDGTALGKMTPDALAAYAGDHAGSYHAQLAFGLQLRKAGQLDRAVAAFERAAALAPPATGPDSPHEQLAAIAIERHQPDRAMAELRALLDWDVDNVEVARQLAALMTREKAADPTLRRFAYERIVAIDPFDGDAHAVLGRLALQRHDADTAVREFTATVALKPVDAASAFTDLAEAYVEAGRRAEGKKQILAALEIAPSYERAQALLLALAGARP